jgi:hypothetical protein
LIGQQEVSAAVEQATETFAKRVDARAWKVFWEGTKEEQEEFQQFVQEQLERDVTESGKSQTDGWQENSMANVCKTKITVVGLKKAPETFVKALSNALFGIDLDSLEPKQWGEDSSVDHNLVRQLVVS